MRTSVQRISTCGDGSAPKNTVTGSAFEKFSPYTVSCFEASGFGFVIAAREAAQFVLGASAARSGIKYFTTPGIGVTGFEGMGKESEARLLLCGESKSTGGT